MIWLLAFAFSLPLDISTLAMGAAIGAAFFRSYHHA